MPVGHHQHLQQIERPALRFYTARECNTVDGEVKAAQRTDPDWRRTRFDYCGCSGGGQLGNLGALIWGARLLSGPRYALGQHARRPGSTPGISGSVGRGQDPGEELASAPDVTALEQIEGGLYQAGAFPPSAVRPFRRRTA